MSYTERRNCRLCSFTLPNQASLVLTPTPPANEFVPISDLDKEQEVFPLELYTCVGCGHVQLPYIVNPSRLFSNYVYVSGTSPVFIDHFKRYAEKMLKDLDLQYGDLVVDIGSNDGTLLKFFKDAGMRVLGIDPAKEIAAKATEQGIDTWPLFFDQKVADDILASYGPAKLVVANNVFAHADDLRGITKGIHKLIKGGGTFVFEVSYLPDVVEKCLFDTIYHEHLAYHTVGALIPFFSSLGMRLFETEHIDTHGGSMRGYVSSNSDPAKAIGHLKILNMLAHEDRMGFFRKMEEPHATAFPTRVPPLTLLAHKIDDLKIKLTTRLKELKAKGKKIAAFGAPAKATTLMYHFGLDKDIIDFVVDDSPLKQGLYTPGKHIPVVRSEMMYMANVDYVVILAWNFADSIMQKHYSFLEQTRIFIVPIPELKEYTCEVYVLEQEQKAKKLEPAIRIPEPSGPLTAGD